MGVGLWASPAELQPAAGSADPTFGTSILVLLEVGYVTIGRDAFSTDVTAGISATVAAVVFVLLWAVDSEPTAPTLLSIRKHW